jgi:hypothetical protein
MLRGMEANAYLALKHDKSWDFTISEAYWIAATGIRA